MKTALADDEQAYLDGMAKLVHDFCTQHCCQMETVPFLNGETFLEAFADGGFSANGNFSAVFMDINMDGVAAAMKIRGVDSGCVLVSLTSSSDFMPDAFSCHAPLNTSPSLSPRNASFKFSRTFWRCFCRCKNT